MMMDDIWWNEAGLDFFADLIFVFSWLHVHRTPPPENKSWMQCDAAQKVFNAVLMPPTHTKWHWHRTAMTRI